MKTIRQSNFLLSKFSLLGCSNSAEKRIEEIKSKQIKKEKTSEADKVPASQRITLDNKGVGSITNVELSPTIDQAMADLGVELFNSYCSAGHITDKRFLGTKPTVF